MAKKSIDLKKQLKDYAKFYKKETGKSLPKMVKVKGKQAYETLESRAASKLQAKKSEAEYKERKARYKREGITGYD